MAAADANGRFDLTTAITYAKMLRAYPLFWFEEPGDPLDYDLQSWPAKFYSGAMATGENLFSHQDARNLLRYGGMRPDRDWLQFDCTLSYGLCEYQRTLKVVQDAGWSPRRLIPHGGHQMSLNIAAGRSRRQRELSRSLPALRRLSRRRPRRARLHRDAGAIRHRLRRQVGSDPRRAGAGGVITRSRAPSNESSRHEKPEKPGSDSF